MNRRKNNSRSPSSQRKKSKSAKKSHFHAKDNRQRKASDRSESSQVNSRDHIRQSNIARGRIVKNPRGFAFVILDPPIPGIDEDIFLDVSEAETLMSQDLVEIRINEDRKSGRKNGSLIRVLERGLDTAVGEFLMGPYGPAVELIGKGMELTVPLEGKAEGIVPGAAVLVKLKYEHQYSATPTAEIIRVVGKSLDPSTDFTYITAKFKFQHEFPADTSKAAADISLEIPASDIAGRKDFRKTAFITIDGATAKDFDDAVYAEKFANGHFRLLVAVADVAHYVRPGQPLDREAYRRGTSTYFPNAVIPMLPEKLSNGVCSLNPREDRLVLVCEIEFDSLGRKLHQQFHEAVIHSQRRCTYDDIHNFLAHPASGVDYPEAVKESIHTLNEVYLFLNRNRVDRGSVDLDIAETQVIVANDGEVKGLKKSERWDSHRLIEECMLAANEAISEFLTEKRIPMLYRVHEAPELEAVGKFCEVARGLGANVSRSEPNPNRMYQKFLKTIKGLPAEPVLNFLLLRSMKQASYSSTNYGHFALASTAYTHFTSPIRRYPDLVVHRILKSYLRKASSDRSVDYNPPVGKLEEIAQNCSRTERHSMEAEREMIRIKQVRYAEKFVGEEFLGTITSMNAKGLFIEIDDLSIDGFLEIDRLGYDYQFSERQMMYQTRKSGRRILLGDKLKVLIARANPHTQRIDLEPADKNIEHRNRSQRAPEDNKRRLEPVMRLESVTKSTETREEARAGGRRGPQAFLERVEKIKSIKKDPSAGPSHPPKPRDKSERKADRGRSRRGGR